MLDSIKTFFADEKVQAFAMGAVAGGLIVGGVTYFATRNTSTVEKAIDKAADVTKDTAAKAADAAEDVANKAADTAEDINPKKDDGPSID